MPLKTTTSLAGFVLALGGLIATLPAHARESDHGVMTSVSAINSARLALYSLAKDDAKVKDVAKETVKLPLVISEVDEEERFLKIKIDSDTYWIRKSQVMVSYALSVGCLAQSNAHTSAAAIRGANPGCKK